MAYGTLKADSITFTSNSADVTTTLSGIYASTTNNLTLTGTASAVTFTGTTGTFTSLTGTTATFTSGIIASGTAALPSLAILSDPNTGIFSPGADQLAVATNGVERVKFGTSEVVFNDGNNDYDFRVESDNNASLLFVDASTDRFGIGHSSPATLIHVADTLAGSPVIARIENFSTSANSDAVLDLKTPNETYTLKALRSSARFDFETGGTPKLSITSAGLVGIGTSAPSAQFVVGSGNTLLGHNTLDNYGGRVDIRSAYSARAANVPAQLFVADSAGSQLINTGGAIDLGGYQDQFSRAYSYARIQGLATSSSGLGGYLSFTVLNGGGSLTERVRIDTAGNVGIGTTSPSRALHVSSSASEQVLLSSTSGSLAGIFFEPNGTTYTPFFGATGTSLVSYTSGSERCRVDGSGRLLVGTTSEAGLNSNTRPVLAGNFVSFTGSVAAATGVATTLFALPDLNATYLVSAMLVNVADANYHAVSLVATIASNSRVIQSILANSITLSLSGGNVQGTQGSGAPQTISFSVTRIANL